MQTLTLNKSVSLSLPNTTRWLHTFGAKTFSATVKLKGELIEVLTSRLVILSLCRVLWAAEFDCTLIAVICAWLFFPMRTRVPFFPHGSLQGVFTLIWVTLSFFLFVFGPYSSCLCISLTLFRWIKHTLIRLASYHVMMRREVEGVLSAQQCVVFVVHVLLSVISPIVIIVFNLYNNEDKQIVRS